MGGKGVTRNRILLFLAPLTVAACLLVIYRLRGIYPFGTLSVVQGDLEQQYCAMYTQLYDVLLGKASPLFSWLTALGRGQSMDMMIFGCFSPLNLLFLLVPRETLLANMSYFVLLKLSLSALTMAWYVQKRFPSLPSVWTVFFGIAYGLSGHALMHFHNTLWLEAMILLPIYLYYAERMLRGGKVLPYALLLASLLLINFYPAAMVCLFTFFAGGAYILLLLPREERGKAVLRIVFGTLLAVLLSAFRTVPAGIQMLRAARFGYAGAPLFEAFTEYSWLRGFALSTACFALVLLPWRLNALVRSGEKRKAAFMGITLLCMLLPLFFDGIDKLWHFGGNIGFAHRFGFITIFTVLAFSAEALTHWETRPAAIPNRKLARIMQYAVTAGVLVCFIYIMLRDGRKACNFIDWNRSLLVVLTVGAAISFLAALLLPDKRVARGLCLALLLLQVGCYGYSAFLRDDTLDLTKASSAEAIAISATLPESDNISRIKIADASLTINYPKYMGRPALSSFSSSTTQATIDTVRAMGYGTSAYAIQDCGGTLFSDALLHVTNTVSEVDLTHDAAYSPRAKVGWHSVYDNVYTLPFGLVGDRFLADIDPVDYKGDCFRLQNALYAAFSGDSEPLLTDAGFTLVDASKDDFARYVQCLPAGRSATSFITGTVSVAGTQRVYLYDRGPRFGQPLSAIIEENGKVVRTVSPHLYTYLDGAYDLGTFTDTDITVTIACGEYSAYDNVCMAFLNLAKLAAFTTAQSAAPAVTNVETGKRSLSLTATAASDGDTLFLPMQYSDNWHARLDGSRANAVRIAGDYMGFVLPKGAHTLTMSYWPAGLTPGILCSALSALAAVWLFFQERRGSVLLSAAPARLSAAAEKLLWAVWLAALLICYVLPVAYAMAFWYKNLH